MADDDLATSDPGWPKPDPPGPFGAPADPLGATLDEPGVPSGPSPAPPALQGAPPAQPSPWIPIPAAAAGPWGRPGVGWVSNLPPGPTPGLLWGDVTVRFGALVIDGLVLVGSVMAIGLLASTTGPPGDSGQAQPPVATAVYLAWWLLALIYHPAFWYVFGATPGQKALGLRVARASDGGSLGIGDVVVRYLIFSLVTVVFPLGLISGSAAARDPYKRAWHDEVARSVVVRRLA
jgi:uncharacterized RDD family membrane protein YckC